MANALPDEWAISWQRVRPTTYSRLAVNDAIEIHGYDEACLVLSVARELRRPVTLVSERGAAGFAGPGWWHALLQSLRRDFPDVSWRAVLDCGESAGSTMAALRMGVPMISFAGPDNIASKLAAMAAAQGAALLRERPLGLDLRGLRDPCAACRVWLREEPMHAA